MVFMQGQRSVKNPDKRKPHRSGGGYADQTIDCSPLPPLTQIPHAVYVALKRGAQTPRLAYPPTRKFWFSGEAFTTAAEQHSVDSIAVHIYSIKKTLADCFKYRNKIGMDAVLEMLALYRDRKNCD